MHNGWPGGGGGEWSQGGPPLAGSIPSAGSSLPQLLAFDGQYGAQLSQQAEPLSADAYSLSFGDPPGQQGDLDATYQMLNQGALDQAQYDMMMGSALGQQGASHTVRSGGFPSQQLGTPGPPQMGLPSSIYAPPPPPPIAYSPANGQAFSSAQPSWSYGAPDPSQSMMHLNSNPYGQPVYGHYPPQQLPPQHLQHQRLAAQPSPHPILPAYSAAPVPVPHPAPQSTIPLPLLAAHCANLDRIAALQNQIVERETFLSSHARGKDPATIAELQRQIYGFRAQLAPLSAQCQSFIVANGGHERVAAEVQAFRSRRQDGSIGPRPQHPPQPLPLPAASLPFSLPQSAHARAFNNLPSTPPVSATPDGSFHSISAPAPSASQPPSSHHTQTMPPPPSRSPHPPPAQQHQPPPFPHQQPLQPAPQPIRPQNARKASGNLPPGLQAQMDAARRAKASQSSQPPGGTASITPLRRDVPIVPLATKATTDGNIGGRVMAPLPRAKELRSATAILAESTPGTPTLAQLQGQLSNEKFNLILPVVLGKQNVRFTPPYSIGGGRYKIDLYVLYQAVMISGHGGEKVTEDGRWSAIAHQINIPHSEGDGLAPELANLYHQVLVPFETVWSSALLAQRDSILTQGTRAGNRQGLGQQLNGVPPPSPISPPAFGFDRAGSLSLAPPPPFNPSNHAYQLGSSPTADSSTTAALPASGAEEKPRQPSGPPSNSTPPAQTASPQSWLAAAAASVPRTSSSGSNLSRRSAGGGRADIGRFEELRAGESEDGGRTRKRSKSGDQSLQGGQGTAFAMPIYPPSSAFTDPTQPMPIPPPQFAQQRPIEDADPYSHYLNTGPTPSLPPSLPVNGLADSSIAGVGPPSSVLGLDATTLGNLGIGLDVWGADLQSVDLGGALGSWEAGSGLDNGFDFESELSKWTAP